MASTVRILGETERSSRPEDEISITVPEHTSIVGPLGGKVIQYVVQVTTILEPFKGIVFSQDEVIEIKVGKSYREFEDIQTKLNRKFGDVPTLPKFSECDDTGTEDKRILLDNWMRALSKRTDQCTSNILLDFLGIDPKMSRFEVICETSDLSDCGSTNDDDFNQALQGSGTFPRSGGGSNVSSYSEAEDLFLDQHIASHQLRQTTPPQPEPVCTFDQMAAHRSSLFDDTEEDDFIFAKMRTESHKIYAAEEELQDLDLSDIQDRLDDLETLTDTKKPKVAAKKPPLPPKPSTIAKELQPIKASESQAAKVVAEDMSGVDILQYIAENQDLDEEVKLF